VNPLLNRHSPRSLVSTDPAPGYEAPGGLGSGRRPVHFSSASSPLLVASSCSEAVPSLDTPPLLPIPPPSPRHIHPIHRRPMAVENADVLAAPRVDRMLRWRLASRSWLSHAPPAVGCRSRSACSARTLHCPRSPHSPLLPFVAYIGPQPIHLSFAQSVVFEQHPFHRF
jgi:hypothetical protein